MSTHSTPVSPRRRASVVRPVLVLCGMLLFSACDQPTQTEVVDGPQFMTQATTACTWLAAGGLTKTVEVTVKLSTGANANGAVVTLIHPTKGPDCWGATASNGKVSFPAITRGSQFLVTVRDEVSVHAPRLEVGPADPNSLALDSLWDAPSIAATRQQPTLLSGAACSKSALTWDNFAGATLCTVPTTGSPTYAVSVQLSDTPVLNVTVLNPDGSPAGNALVAAISTPAALSDTTALKAACESMPWLDPIKCKNTNEFSGPGLVQAMSVTPNSGLNKGQLGLGVAQGENHMVIEVTAPQNGFTMFGTLELSPIATMTNSGHTVYLAPGMCSITEVKDAVEPADFSELNIRRSEHSLGLSAVAPVNDPLGAMILKVESSSIVVRAVIDATKTGGTGNFTFQYAGTSGGNKTIRIPFSISADVCKPGLASGNGVGGGVDAVLHCMGKDPVGDDLTEFDLYFTITGLPELSRADYKLDAAKDNLDPSRADGTEGRNLSRGAINIDLTQTKCDVPKNNDGRWLVV